MPPTTRNASKRKLEKAAVEEAPDDIECPICYEPIENEHSFCCPSDHHVCFSCVQKLIVPIRRSDPTHAGLGWKCPVCRGRCGLDMMQMLSVVKGSFFDAHRLFHDGHHYYSWSTHMHTCSCTSAPESYE